MSLPRLGWEETVASGVHGLPPFLTLTPRDAARHAESCPKARGMWQVIEGSLWRGTMTLSLEGHPPRGQPATQLTPDHGQVGDMKTGGQLSRTQVPNPQRL